MAILDVRGWGLDVTGPDDIMAGIAQGSQLGKLQRASKIRGLLGQAQEDPNQQQQMLAEQSMGLGEDEAISQAAPTQDDLVAEARKIDPLMAEQYLKSIGLDSEGKRQEASRFAAQAMTLPPAQQDALIMQRAESLKAQGRNPKDTLELLDMPPAEREQALMGVQLMDLSTKERMTLQARQAEKTGLGSEVKSSSILDDGTTIQVMKDGSTKVTSPTGDVLEGAARSDAIRKAQSYGVSIQQQRAKGRKAGALTATAADKIYEAADNARANIRNLESVIQELDKGASTGVINKYLPTFKESTLRLKNLKNRLGLDVVGSTTFGALSESELNMAMDTALPEGLSPPELRKWTQDRINAQRKVAQAMEEEAIFISKSGNTRAMWREKVMQNKADQQNVPRETTAVPQTSQPTETYEQRRARLLGK